MVRLKKQVTTVVTYFQLFLKFLLTTVVICYQYYLFFAPAAGHRMQKIVPNFKENHNFQLIIGLNASSHHF
jgi:hypothetical protein